MKDKSTDFPQYRKLSNGKVFYRILDDRHFDEIQLMGTKVFYYSHEAQQYPEILKIREMLDVMEPYERCAQEEFERYTPGK